MYSTCIFCQHPLGANEAVESFPVGRKLAFDAEKGRLWVVCPTCGRWNLSPLEQRWEAIEECERSFRGTRVRVSTEQIGLARLAEGTELIRVGRPLRPEFAAWRYGAQFGGRERRALLNLASAAGVSLGVAGALATGLPALALAGLPVWAAARAAKSRLPRGASFWEHRAGVRGLRDDTGEPIVHGDRGLWTARLRTGPEIPRGWTLRVTSGVWDKDTNWWVDEREHLVSGSAGVHAVAMFLARANASGGSRGLVQDAVQRISRAGDSARYFALAESEARRLGWGHQDVWNMPVPVRLALEMAAHEDAERAAMEGELADLEHRWREAEEIAAIADRLAVPASVEARLDQLRRRLKR
ncbi:MAG TPA: hypothetical protein VF263_04650 [Longimicrobiaceae bacterium]